MKAPRFVCMNSSCGKASAERGAGNTCVFCGYQVTRIGSPSGATGVDTKAALPHGHLALLRRCALVGGTGLGDLTLETWYDLRFRDVQLEVVDQGTATVRRSFDYGNVIALRADGPGMVRKGPRVIGLGVTGLVEATIINKIVSRTSIQSYIEIQDPDSHLIFLNSEKTPATIDFELKAVQGKLRQITASPRQSADTPPEDLVEKLERLGLLRVTGVLTDEEFQAAKSRLLRAE
jgi:hypothetical protein